MSITVSNKISSTNAAISAGVLTISGSSKSKWRKFKTNITAQYITSGGESVTKTFADFTITYGTDGTNTATLDVSDALDGGTMTLKGNYSLAYYPDLSGLDGCTCSTLESWYFYNDTFTATLTADNGKKFDTENVPYLPLNNAFGEETKHYFTISEDAKTAAISVTLDESPTAQSYLKPVAVCIVDGDVKTITLDNQISGTDASYTQNENDFTVKLVANVVNNSLKNVQFQYVNVDGETVTVDVPYTYIRPNAYATATIPVKENTTVVITGNYGEFTYVDFSNLTGATGIYTPDLIYKGDTVNVTLTANENTVFAANNLPYLVAVNAYGEDIKNYFTLSGDESTATLNITLSYLQSGYGGRLLVYGATIPKKQVTTAYGAINAYVVDNDILNSFAQKRFFVEESESAIITVSSDVDLGEYIHHVKRLYVDVEKDVETVIRCGNYNTTIPAYNPKTDVVTLDFGKVGIPSHNGNGTDFQGSVTVFLPFVGFTDIGTDYIGKEITLTCEIDIITGTGVYKLSYNGITFKVVDVNPNTDVLYRTISSTNVETFGGDNWTNAALYGLKPYIFVKWYESVNPDGRNTTRIRAKLDDLTGFNAVDDTTTITVNKMLCSEQNEIYNLLQNGVYF